MPFAGKRLLLHPDVDLGISVGRVQADVAEPTLMTFTSTPDSSKCTAVVWNMMPALIASLSMMQTLMLRPFLSRASANRVRSTSCW